MLNKGVSNQRYIQIPTHIIKDKIILDSTTLSSAMSSLTSLAGLKLWLYLYQHQENQGFLLSSQDFVLKSSSSRSAYTTAFNELVDKGYLIETIKKNYYIFVANPNIILKDTKDNNINDNKISLGEQKIIELLQNNNIDFIREATFGTCLFPDTFYPARFDFYINHSYLIEYDGEQHFSYSNRGWNTEEQYKKTLEHDEYKNQWCKNNNIPLIRIPYTHLKDLNINDLLLSSTSFLIN